MRYKFEIIINIHMKKKIKHNGELIGEKYFQLIKEFSEFYIFNNS